MASFSIRNFYDDHNRNTRAESVIDYARSSAAKMTEAFFLAARYQYAQEDLADLREIREQHLPTVEAAKARLDELTKKLNAIPDRKFDERQGAEQALQIADFAYDRERAALTNIDYSIRILESYTNLPVPEWFCNWLGLK